MRLSLNTLLVLSLLGACSRDPLREHGALSDGGGSSGATGNTTGGSGGGTDLSIARIGDDGVCGVPCPDGQQCCFSTGRCVAPNRVDSECPAPAPQVVRCGGVMCPTGQICCLVNGNCIDPSTAGTNCQKPSAPSSGGAISCASNADCRPSEFCSTALASLCQGPGTCQSRSNCGSSSGSAQYCGCDGANYPDIQSACRAGVDVLADSPCGTPVAQGGPGAIGPRDPVTYCARADQCPRGQQCCSITGRCYDASIPYLCTLPPQGTSISCFEDRQCNGFEFCSGSGCSGPGGCLAFAVGDCGGELKPVCGCDGKSYTNAGCATAVGVRIAGDGACAGADAGLEVGN
jgi:hypothetical protein